MAKKKTQPEQLVVEAVSMGNNELVNTDLLRLYAEQGLNVMLIGDHGVGKTHLALDAFRAAGLKVKYFGASTLDPWVDFLGIPKDVDGRIEMLKPRWLQEEFDAIFLDEFNRAPMKVKNGVMELLQFKTINGEPLNKLKCIWTAINPYGSNIYQYDVDPIDEAQKDRFHVHINVPFRVNTTYFEEKYGLNGERACEWWFELKETQKMVSPRRLDYALEIWNIGGDITHVLPKETVPSTLISRLTKGSIVPTLRAAVQRKDRATTTKILADGNNYESVVGFCQSRRDVLPFVLSCMSEEQKAIFFSHNQEMLAELYVEDVFSAPEGIRQVLQPLQDALSEPDGEEYNKWRNLMSSKVPKFTAEMLDPNRVPVQLLPPGTHGTLEDVGECLAQLTILPSLPNMKSANGEIGFEEPLRQLQTKIGRDIPPIENLDIALMGMLIVIGQRMTEPDLNNNEYVKDMAMSLFNLLVRVKNPPNVDEFIVSLMQDEKFANWAMKAQLTGMMQKAAK